MHLLCILNVLSSGAIFLCSPIYHQFTFFATHTLTPHIQWKLYFYYIGVYAMAFFW